MNCENCVAASTKPLTNRPLLRFTHSLDRGRLLYLSDQLLFVLDTLRAFADRALKDGPSMQMPLSSLVAHAVPALCHLNLLKCHGGCDDAHRWKLMELIPTLFFRPLLVNHASNVIDKHDAYKFFLQGNLYQGRV